MALGESRLSRRGAKGGLTVDAGSDLGQVMVSEGVIARARPRRENPGIALLALGVELAHAVPSSECPLFLAWSRVRSEKGCLT